MAEPKDIATGIDRVWAITLAFWLSSITLLGGTGFPNPVVQIYFTFSSLALIVFGLWRIRGGLPSGLAFAMLVLAALSVCLVFAQLIPLPIETWKLLPGREVPLRALEAIGQLPAQLPLSLNASATRQSAVSLLPPLAAFVAILTVARRYFWMMSAAIVVCAMIGSGIGMVQNGLGAQSGLFFYHDPGSAKFATGTFANKNFFAVQLYASLPFLAAFAMFVGQTWRLRPLVTSFFTLVYVGLLIAVLAAVGSRGGIVFAMASVLATMLLVFRPSASSGGRLSAGKGIILLLVGLVIMAQASMVGVLRLAETDPISDFRSTIASVSLQAAQAQFPWGSGFGTFVEVYQLYETPQTIIDPYINHAHNEWLQLAIEGGAPAMLLMALFVVWLAYALIKAFRLAANDPAHAHIRAAGVVAVLILLHSIVDFPLRTDAHLTLLGLCVGFLALATAPARSRVASGRTASQPIPVDRQKLGQPSAFRPANRGFAPRKSTPPPDAGESQ